MAKIGIIGAGFSGIAAATLLADQGHEVVVLEKNEGPGGRARTFAADGFTFDMGPSWYWMPDIFENYFNRFGKSVSDYYELVRLDPSYRIYFGENDFEDIPASLNEIYSLFEQWEPGSSKKLKGFLAQAEYKYKVGISEFVWKPGKSIFEFFDLRILKSAMKLQMFSSISSEIRGLFSNEKIIKLLEFPVLFLGATPQKTPALYSLMNYADLSMGTWYPIGGMYKIIEGMVDLAQEKGVNFYYNKPVKKIEIVNGVVRKLKTTTEDWEVDGVIAGADYHHIEQQVIDKAYRLYDEKYWDKRTMAPSSLLFYLGIDTKVPEIKHHNLFFDEDFAQHAEEIYTKPAWPSNPLFYLCCPSKTDSTVAPTGQENLFLLMPLAPGLEDTNELREKYFLIMMGRIKKLIGFDLVPHIVYKRSYCVNDFVDDYNAFKGNAYGLANTLKQTSFLKPKINSKKIKNLYFTGQLTTPGPGVPPSLISGQMVALELIKDI